MDPGKKRLLPQLTATCRGTKVSLKPLYPCLQIAVWGFLAVCGIQAWPRKPQRSFTNCHLSQLGGLGEVNKCHLNSKHLWTRKDFQWNPSPSWYWPEAAPHLPEVDPSSQRSVPSWSLPAPETSFGETPTAPAVEMKRRLHVFTEEQWHITLFKGPWVKQSQLTFEHPVRSQLKYGWFWAHFH